MRRLQPMCIPDEDRREFGFIRPASQLSTFRLANCQGKTIPGQKTKPRAYTFVNPVICIF
jgi:hypothetical protein